MTQEVKPVVRGAQVLRKLLLEQARFAAQSGQALEMFQDNFGCLTVPAA